MAFNASVVMNGGLSVIDPGAAVYVAGPGIRGFRAMPNGEF